MKLERGSWGWQENSEELELKVLKEGRMLKLDYGEKKRMIDGDE